ncbi:UDP-glucose 4-epimerase GalE [Porticoccaceae bacterium]|nr:UDP-glucose 4-epimerase GalE [Porticoccaceae bacterium]
MMILITGGAGYIGSHTCLSLLEAKHKIFVLDNLVNSSFESMNRVAVLANQNFEFIEGSICDYDLLDDLFLQHNFKAVIHFAGLKSVGESVVQPLEYYQNNVCGSLQLFKVMQKHDVKNIVFSSSATVYGDPTVLPLTETMPTGFPTNPYGKTKLMIEGILQDLYRSDNTWNIVNLRYFNPAGAHESGLIGEDPNGVPNNLFPYISQTATGRREKLGIFGDDYDTPDGTGVRDYIHVIDLAEAHLKAYEKISSEPGFYTINLSTGVGYSVFEVVKEFSKVSGVDIPYEVLPRRSGDIAAIYADPKYAYECLGWKAEKGLNDMCQDIWRWQSKNPNGYEK